MQIANEAREMKAREELEKFSRKNNSVRSNGLLGGAF